jgi:hypothetical protein
VKSNMLLFKLFTVDRETEQQWLITAVINY